MTHSRKHKNHKKRVSKRRKQKTRHSKKYTKSYLFNGGNCAAPMPSLVQSGGNNITAYSIPSNAYAFNFVTGTGGDPIAPSNVISSSNLPNISSTGGKSKKSKKIKNRMKGGSIASSINDFLLSSTTGATANQVLSSGSSISAPVSTNILSGLSFINPATHIQPTSNIFSNTNPPLA